MEKNLSQVVYDARFSVGAYRGMGRFLRFLIAGREREFIGLCAPRESDPSLKLISGGPSFYPLWEQMTAPQLAKSVGARIYLAPYNTAPLTLPKNVKLILVVHDLIYMQRLPWSRSIYQNAGRYYRRAVVPRALKRADVIVTETEFTAAQLTSLGAKREKITIIPFGINEAWFARPSPPSSQNYLLMVSGEAPSKNLPRALEAMGRVCSRNAPPSPRIKIAGVKSAFHERFRSLAARRGIGDKVEFLGYLSESEMRNLYRSAKLFVMPSLFEGFGIPMLEAMASGVPVAASSTSCLPEIGGAAVRYFDPWSVRDMTAVISDLLIDDAEREAMSLRGMKRAQDFHPDTLAERVRTLWNQHL